MKCITFDKEAQDNLPQHIKNKMRANMDKAIKERENKVCDPTTCDKLDGLSIFYDPCNDCDLH